MKKIGILGSTGSIGTQTLEVVRNRKDIQVCGLAAKGNIEELERQISEFRPSLVAVWDEEKARELRKKVGGKKVEVLSGLEGLCQVAKMEEVDLVVTALVGMIGILPTLEAIRNGKDIGLANKETLVTAGHLIMPLAREKGVKILPVDSEHSAIFQCLEGNQRSQVRKLILTASGGPFRNKSKRELEEVTLEEALCHPNWSMGQKITIDSSTMVNKGLEVIEARWLFDMEVDRIQVVIQPQSIIHSMVEYIDGSIIAQLGTPDMCIPIQYALSFPNRWEWNASSLDVWSLSRLDFQKPDFERFPGLALAYEAGRIGGSLPTVLNAANEYAVSQFLEKKIGYLDIIRWIEESMQSHTLLSNPSFEEILEVEQEVYDRLKTRKGGR